MDHVRILHRITLKVLYTLCAFSIRILYHTEGRWKENVFVLVFIVYKIFSPMELFLWKLLF
jgi:hypothetical protein